MLTFEDIKELAKQFDKTIADANKNPKLGKLVEYTGDYSTHYTNVYAKYDTLYSEYWNNQSAQAKQDFLEKTQLEIAQHIEFIKSVAMLKEAVDNPVNNPREIKLIRNSKDKHVKENAVKIMPILKEVLNHAVKTMEFKSNIQRSDNRGEILKYLSQSLTATADVVNSKFQDPGKLEVLLNSINQNPNKNESKQFDARNFMTKTCSKNPQAGLFLGVLMESIGITMVLMAAPLSIIPGALPVTLPLIAAGLILIAIGAKLASFCEPHIHNNKSKMRQEQFTTGIEKFSTKYTEMIKSKEVKDAYKNADQVVRKAEGIEMQTLGDSPRMGKAVRNN